MTVAELQDRMSSLEFAEWIAYSQIQPFGETRNDERSGVIASAVANVHRKKGAKPYTWLRFFPPWSERKPKKDWHDLMDKARAIVRAFGGTLKD